MIDYAGEDVELGEHSSIDGGNANLYNKHFGNQYGGLSEIWESTYLKTQQDHSWAYTQRILNHTMRTLQCVSVNIRAPTDILVTA